LTTQDLEKGIDLTGQTSVTVSQINQLVDIGRPATDKGFNIVTTDTALNVPEVPNPDVLLEGVTPTHWYRYLWIRKPFDNTGIVKLYAWNVSKTPDATLLKWELITPDVASLATQAALDAVEVKADQGIADAAAADSQAATALSVATAAQDAATGALDQIPAEVTDLMLQ
jgi:hypothetical protein